MLPLLPYLLTASPGSIPVIFLKEVQVPEPGTEEYGQTF